MSTVLYRAGEAGTLGFPVDDPTGQPMATAGLQCRMVVYRAAAESIPAARDAWDFRSGIPAGVTGVAPGVPGGTAPVPVVLTVTTASGIEEDDPVGTAVAAITTDATSLVLAGVDAGILSVSGSNVVTTAALTGRSSLAFTVTGSASGKTNTTVGASLSVSAVAPPEPEQVALTVTPATGIVDDAAVGTTVATLATDATALSLAGADAALLTISGLTVRTAASITGKTSLGFTVTGTAEGKTDRAVPTTVPVTAASGGTWTYPVFTGATLATISADIVVQENGDQWVVSTGNTGNGRACVQLAPSKSYTVETHLEFGDATRIICRRINAINATSGTEVWAMDRGGLTRIDRTDTVTTDGTRYFFQYVGVSLNGQKFIINSTTRYREVA